MPLTPSTSQDSDRAQGKAAALRCARATQNSSVRHVSDGRLQVWEQ